MDNTSFKVITYNVKYFKEEKVPFCKDLLNQCTILCLQEHCLYKSTLHELCKLGNISYHGSSAMNESEPLIGRPHGGCAIVWSNQLSCQVDPVDIMHDRICAVRITLYNNLTVLLINTYLPCDSQNRDSQYEDTVDTLNLISCIINDQKCDLVMVAGDFNAQLTRTTPHVQTVKNFLENNSLQTGLDHILADVEHTFHSLAHNTYSLIDHVCVCESLFGFINQYVSVDSVNNMSDHCALLCNFDKLALTYKRYDRVYSRRAAWHKAMPVHVQKYQSALDRLLSDINLPLDSIHCNDYNCPTNNAHRNDIDSFISDIVQCCIKSENECIPKTANKVRGTKVPGWNDFVKGKHEKALYWHNVWKEAGRPKVGELVDNMRDSRHDYHYAIRFCKRNSDTITATKMAEAISSGKHREFWKEIGHMQRSSKSVPTTVDNANNKHDIADLFFNKFKDLYNAKDHDTQAMECINMELTTRIRHCHNKLSHIVSVNTIRRLTRKLKGNKIDGLYGLNSNSIIYGSQRLFVYLAIYFSALLSHGHTSEMLLLGTMCPIPKSNVLNNSDKYRAIALCSSIAKLFDLLVIDTQRLSLESDPLQFGFKSERSTTLCTLMLTGVADKFVKEGSSVYTVLLDMSKAFDRVNYCKLFEILLQKNMDPLFIRCLLFSYLNQRLRVKWDDTFSPYFNVTCGVKQGGVLSPLLFCIYVDELIHRLRNSTCGCYMGPHFTGALCYADDMVLMSPSVTGLKHMLKVCERFAQDYGLFFNASKTQFIVFRKKPHKGDIVIKFNDTVITEQQRVLHLGHTIYNDLNKGDTERILSSFFKQYNLFRSKFGSIPSLIQAKLMGTYCTSFYGSNLITLKQTERLQVAWRKCLRQVWRVPYRTHCDILRNLSDGLCEFHTFIARFAKFSFMALKSKCDTIQHIAQCMLRSNCTFAKNVKELAFHLGLDLDDLKCINVNELLHDIKGLCKGQCKSDVIITCLASVVKELSQTRDNLMDCNLSRQETHETILDICVN